MSSIICLSFQRVAVVNASKRIAYIIDRDDIQFILRHRGFNKNGCHLAHKIFLFLISLKFVPDGPVDNRSALVQFMAWCHQAPSHKLGQCWPRSMMPYDVTRLQWVNSLRSCDAYLDQWTGLSLVQVMACRSFGTKPSLKNNNADLFPIGEHISV